jgi:hypothetical protein
MNSSVVVRQVRVLVLLALAGVLASQNLEATLVASYSFENGTADGATADGSQNLTLFGDAAVTSPGIVGNGKLSLDGSGDYATSPSPGTNVLTSGASGVTLSTWFRTATIASNTQQVLIQMPIAGGTLAQSGAGLDISSGKLQAGGRSVSSEGFQFNDATSPANTLNLASNTTYFAAGVIDYANDKVTAYLYDGATWKIQTVNVAFTNSVGANNQLLSIGRRADNQRPFNGAIDGVKIFNNALSETEVKALIAPEVPEPTGLAIVAMLVGGACARRRGLRFCR